jgi:hypothetical protein
VKFSIRFDLILRRMNLYAMHEWGFNGPGLRDLGRVWVVSEMIDGTHD